MCAYDIARHSAWEPYLKRAHLCPYTPGGVLDLHHYLEGVQKSDPGVAILCGLADPSDLAMDGSE